jgi:ABC-type polysaccharide/polyol phosphate transport system ATPase subunit
MNDRPVSSGQTAVRLVDAGKRYVKYQDTPTLLSGAARLWGRTKRSALWAVRHVDLEVAPGEALGVIGRNGAGKSTMLRMLAGVTAPTEGLVAVRGRVAPLIAVGVGFHPELTGRENVYVNGIILGLTRKQIDERFDEIIDFAEIAEFIDTPVKFYSSGMFVRLGFAVAVAAEPDVLLVDEVLAVGDIVFQMKCFHRMRELQAQGTTMLVVSHNLNAVRNFCNRVLVMHEGTSRFVGATDDGISVLHELLAAPPTATAGEQAEPDAAGAVEFLAVELVDDTGSPRSHFEVGEKAALRMRLRFRRSFERAAFSLSVATESGVLVYADSTFLRDPRPYRAGDEVTCEATFVTNFTTGSFTARGGVIWGDDPDHRLLPPPVHFYVSGGHFVGGIVDLGATFDVGGPVHES